ncbi:MAG: PQQ-binding-like beta-propeller repeat protein, partial [Myxococcota bacterium]
CRIPDGSGRFVMGEDTGQPSPPAGWGVFEADGSQAGKLTATYFAAQAEPYGCAFTEDGLLFTVEVGDQGGSTGQLILWFPPFDVFPGPPGVYPATNAASTNFCKIATDLGTGGGIAIDANGSVYVASTAQLKIERFDPPFPTGPDAAGGCGSSDALGSPLADTVNRSLFVQGPGLTTFAGLAFSPFGTLYAASVVTGEISEYTPGGTLVRKILDPPESLPPIATGTPQGIAVGGDGTVYYADLDLEGTFPDLAPGPDGRFWRIRFDAMNEPLPPEPIQTGLAFPDGVGILPGNLEPLSDWPSYAGGPERLFFNPEETIVDSTNVGFLTERWSFPTGAVITGSPTVGVVDLPGEGPTQIVYFQSWDGFVYAVRLRAGTLLWSFQTVEQPGASFPNTASIHLAELNGDLQVFIGSGETFHALDAATGAELWRFTAGSGCLDAMGQPPGLCGFSGERNEIESSAYVADGKVFFGMDVNDVATGKGGFYALDALDGRLAWFFDLETGSTCVPDPGDDIRHFDGYHSESELGLPAGFFATRSGCDFARTRSGCGNVWSSPAVDEGRGQLYFASSNCDTDDDPGTSVPPPPMPPYDEAIVALDFDGTPAWRWRPREVDNDDLAFGGVPNLFTIDFGGAPREVVGVGNKDGGYYVLDRDGVNEVSGVAWDDADPSALPYWSTQVVPGGDIGGILATAAVDDVNGRIYLTTALGTGAANAPPNPPQRPTVHALDADTGAIVWDNSAEAHSLARFAPTSAIPEVVFSGAVPGALLRPYSTVGDAGTPLASFNLGNAALASAPAVVDGIILVGAGIGTRTESGDTPSDITAAIPSPLTALCVPGTLGCAFCGNGNTEPELDEECDDGNTVDGDGCWTTCEKEDGVAFEGTALGGTLQIIVDGVVLQMTTTPGQSAETVAAYLAAATQSNPTLAARGVGAVLQDNAVISNGIFTGPVISDAGLVSVPPPEPPRL